MGEKLAVKEKESLSLEPSDRKCTRCDGTQVSIGNYDSLGLFVCDTCDMRVGYDLNADPSEFLAHRGKPSHYTENTFGDRLQTKELRL